MISINETLTAKGYTPAWQVPAVFGRARTLDGIVIHHWGALGQTHSGVVNFFTNGPGTTSAHFVASSDGVHCLVSPDDAAWHSGNAAGNATTIGIECRPEATDADYQAVAELVAWLRTTYGAALPLSPHRQWQATACPGVWDLTRLDRMARNIIRTPITEQDTAVADAQDYIQKIAYTGWKDKNGKAHPGFMLVGEETQERVDELKAEVANLSAKLDKVLEAVSK